MDLCNYTYKIVSTSYLLNMSALYVLLVQKAAVNQLSGIDDYPNTLSPSST